MSSYLERKTARAKLKGCRSVVMFGSSGGLIVSDKLQIGTAIVLDELQRLARFHFEMLETLKNFRNC